MPADNEVQRQIRKDRYPHLVEASPSRKTSAKFTSVGTAARVHARERESHWNTRREVVCDSDKKKIKLQRAKRSALESKRRDARIDDLPEMPDDPTDQVVAQTTPWCWKPLASIPQTIQRETDCCPESEAAMKTFTS